MGQCCEGLPKCFSMLIPTILKPCINKTTCIGITGRAFKHVLRPLVGAH